MNRAPVGILDSGFGGLSVYAALRKLLPGESTVFAADCAGAPWGDRSDEYILERLEGLVGFLLSRNVKAIVLACNTATAVGAAVLRARLSIPVIGIEPAVLPGCRETKTKVIGVLATTKTIRSAKYRHLKTLAPADVKVLDQPCPGLMDCVEKGAFHASETVELARRYVAPLVKEHADRLVLGCTHYPFLSDVLHVVAGPGVELIDPAPAVVRQLERRLAANDALSDGFSPEHRFFVTGANERRETVLRLLAGENARLEALGGDFQARTVSLESMK